MLIANIGTKSKKIILVTMYEQDRKAIESQMKYEPTGYSNYIYVGPDKILIDINDIESINYHEV